MTQSRPAPSRAGFLALTLLALAAACSDPERETPPRAPAAATPPPARRTVDAGVPRWTRDGDAADTLLAEPVALVAGEGLVYLADAGARRVVALDAATGATRWILGAGAVPGGLLQPFALTITSRGMLAVADVEARRIHLLTRDGTLRATLALPDAIAPRRLCARADGGFLAGGADARGRLVVLDARGRVESTLALPWPDADTLGAIRSQAVLASTADGAACVAALKLGRGWALLSPATAGAPPRAAPHAYVEPLALPPLTVRESGDSAHRVRVESLGDAPLAARDVAVGGARVWIAFQGTTPDRARLVDAYDLARGEYLGTLRLATPVYAVAADESTVYALQRRAGRWALSAIAARAALDAAVAAPRVARAGAAHVEAP